MFDCSFIPSYKCNLKCWFCMYDCGPDQNNELSIEKAKCFISRINLTKINQFGFYGGEISINLDLYQKFINLIPNNVPRFTITNGAWSRNSEDTKLFMEFIRINKLNTKISSTGEHKKHQNQKILEKVLYSKKCKDIKIIIKKNDDTKSKLLPMGRLSNRPSSCSLKCLKIPSNKPFRIAMRPDGNIIFQNCDGIYPVVGNYKSSLEEIEEKIYNLRKEKRKIERFC